MRSRDALRDGRNGGGGVLGDCWAAAVCFPCVLCQLARSEGLSGRHYRVFARDGGGCDVLTVVPGSGVSGGKGGEAEACEMGGGAGEVQIA